MADEKDAEFAFDLFSDIAPLLALFGDQFARQFASESLTWVDHLIFAMVPLGILTVITGAIRVQGPRIAKSFIGRARENRALAELELMSSTSGEVCELFNGKSIIRAMGKPKIAQILIFPDEYDELSREYEKLDRKEQGSEVSGESVVDTSCGIHTLRTAVLTERTGKARLMDCVDYHSYSHQLINHFLESTGKRINKVFPGLLKSGSSTLDDSPNPKGSFTWLGPPNLQLGLSSNQYDQRGWRKRHEILLAAVAAVSVQVSLLAIATVTVFHQRTRRAISSEPKRYGYPCYMIGSVLLSIGIGLCSLAVEPNTIEHDWTVQNPARKEADVHSGSERTCSFKPEKDACPRLLWLQQSQEVNEQTFDGYAILAGPKHHIITSSRIEDTEDNLNSSSPISNVKGKTQDAEGVPVSSQSKGAPTKHVCCHDPRSPSLRLEKRMLFLMLSQSQRDKSHLSNPTWEIITVCAVMSAGLGFIAQFMGLRGLTYPCSIAQLAAIFLMALVRALIRRRLGRVPAHCSAMARHEVDFLATQIVRYREFRNFHQELQNNTVLLEWQNPQDFMWRVRTANSGKRHPVLFDLPQHTSNTISQTDDKRNSPIAAPEAVISSGQLLRVRERLGDLCGWPSLALDSARSLVQSIETFMNTFFPYSYNEQGVRRSGKRLDSLLWVVETTAVLSAGNCTETPDCITIPVRRLPKTRKWQVDIGRVDAILSLWMANIMAKATEASKGTDKTGLKKGTEPISASTNWRRTKAGTDLRHNFCRILGDNLEDGTLRRDLAWWADEYVTDEITKIELSGDTLDDDPETKHAPQTCDDSAKHSPDKAAPEPTWPCSKARAGAPELIIGFNGHPSPKVNLANANSSDTPEELAITSSGFLPTILAQHLFTSFMWTVVERLPNDCLRQGMSSNEQDVEIDGRHAFDPHEFDKTWLRPTLRHRRMTTLIHMLENYGLGSYKEILLCMIPSLSFKDLLPNHVILKLIPQMRQGRGWVATARSYNRLLETNIRTNPEEEAFCYSTVVATMEFLYFACEPYDRWIKPSLDELTTELENLVARLTSPKYAPVIRRLAPAYGIQRRRDRFEAIFAQFGSIAGTVQLEEPIDLKPFSENKAGSESGLASFGRPDTPLDLALCEAKLGFSKRYRDIYSSLGKAVTDISLQEKKQQSLLPRTSVREAKTADIFGWTPLHYAAFVEDYQVVERIFKPSDVRKDLSIHQILDKFNRSPVHAVASAGSLDHLDWALECLSEEDKKHALHAAGLDGMTPLHLATMSGKTRCVEKIIETSEQSLTYSDFWGREALHLAASFGHEDIGKLLLQRGSRLDTIDETRRSPLAYLLKGDVNLKDDMEQNEDENDTECCSTRNDSEYDNHRTFRNDDPAETDTLGLVNEDTGGLILPSDWDQANIHQKTDILNAQQISNEHLEDIKASIDASQLHLVETQTLKTISDSFSNQNSSSPVSPTEDVRSEGTESVFDSQQEHARSVSEDNDLTNKKRRMFVEFALKQPKYRDKQGKTFLHLAVEHADLETVGMLLKRDYQVDDRDFQGRTPLQLAISADRTQMALTLLRGLSMCIADPSAKDEQGETALMYAARKGNIEIAEFLVASQLSQVRYLDTVLHSKQNVDPKATPNSEAKRMCDPLARNLKGRTALHIAIAQDQQDRVTKYLLEQEHVQDNPKDNDGDSLLITACITNTSAACIREILKRWPALINEPSVDFDQTPLSWACEKNYRLIVKTLLKNDDIDVNRPCGKWKNYTPLHFAAEGNDDGHSDIIKLLLDHETIEMEPTDDQNRTPLNIAIRNCTARNVREFLIHPKYSFDDRLNRLSQLCDHSLSEMHGIIPDVFEHISDAELKDDALIELISLSEDFHHPAPHTAFVQRAFTRETWKHMAQPLHKAVRLGSLQAMQLSIEQGIAPTVLDEDNWSCLEYAAVYRSEPLDGELVRHVQKYTPVDYKKPEHILPGPLWDPDAGETAMITTCRESSHKACTGVHVVNLRQPSGNPWMSVRTLNCVPPPTEDSQTFYFEVTLRKDSESKMFCLGFCDKNFSKTGMPGLDHLSFAYHGDDGEIYVNGSVCTTATSDFGPQGQYGKGDTVGIGLHLGTGEGFVTLNGSRKDIGDAFKKEKFRGRKMYPCVGFDTNKEGVGLEFEINLGASLNHPLKYTSTVN